MRNIAIRPVVFYASLIRSLPKPPVVSLTCPAFRRPLEKLCLSTMGCSKGSSETMKVQGSDGTCKNMKKKAKMELRTHVKKMMKTTSQEELEAGGEAVRDRVVQLHEWKDVKSVFIYLSMPWELSSKALVETLFTNGCKVYVPRIVGKESKDMKVVQVRSQEEMETFPMSSWNIPEPPIDSLHMREDALETVDLGMVICPGTAFTKSCERMGHGKGFYDTFLLSYAAKAIEKQKKPVIKVGICMDAQIVESIGQEAHDISMDYVITPQKVYKNPLVNIPP